MHLKRIFKFLEFLDFIHPEESNLMRNIVIDVCKLNKLINLIN
jgi:hypothetical protein